MNHIEFIEKHVREELIRQGFTVAVAQGGHFRLWICTGVCHRQAGKGEYSMMLCGTRSYGQKNRLCRLTSSRRSGQNAMNNKGCSEKAKAAVREHQRLSDANDWINSQE